LIDSAGKVAFSYLRRPALPEAAIMVRDNNHIRVVTTEPGGAASAICFEADFPELVDRGHDSWCSSDTFGLPPESGCVGVTLSPSRSFR
jgi:hypothetical protein